jgi:hypothetical protein
VPYEVKGLIAMKVSREFIYLKREIFQFVEFDVGGLRRQVYARSVNGNHPKLRFECFNLRVKREPKHREAVVQNQERAGTRFHIVKAAPTGFEVTVLVVFHG